MSGADLSGPYWMLERAQSLRKQTTYGEYNYTKAQFQRDLSTLFGSADGTQFCANLKRLERAFSRQTLKRVMEYIVAKIDSGELVITVQNEIKCLNVRMLAKSGLVKDHIWEESGRFGSVVLTGEIAQLDLRWAYDQLVKFKVKDAATTIAKLAPQVVKNVIQQGATAIVANTPEVVKTPVKAAANWISAHPAKAATAASVATVTVGMFVAPVSVTLAVTGLVGYTIYRILG